MYMRSNLTKSLPHVLTTGSYVPVCVTFHYALQISRMPAGLNIWYWMQVWGIIDQKVGPYIRQVSFLNTALRFGQRWFLSTGRPWPCICFKQDVTHQICCSSAAHNKSELQPAMAYDWWRCEFKHNLVMGNQCVLQYLMQRGMQGA